LEEHAVFGDLRVRYLSPINLRLELQLNIRQDADL